ncbi:MAG: PQQ-binding-like beta-propeller repeat protein, partial [Planctomycetota bacterium]
MSMKRIGRAPALSIASLVLFALAASLAAAPAEEEAKAILDAAGVTGGLIVHIGCGDGRLTAGLRANDGCVVHGLDPDAADIAKASQHIQAKGLYGPVSVEHWQGPRLPYSDDLVTLVVSDDLGKVTMGEMMRALRPGGVAYIKTGGGWKKTVKPRPATIDEWTHYLHDASGNAVAADSEVRPPKHMRWKATPLYARSHEIDTTVAALVSARGRLFYILDEGLTGITDQRLPQTWAIVARDAFNGVELWRRPLPHWGWRQWKEKQLAGKDWTALRGQRTRTPASVPRRLVAEGDRVFATLGFHAPLSILDAATGEVLHTCKGTEGTDEILVSDGTALAYIPNPSGDAARRRGEKPAPSALVAVDAATGTERWRQGVSRIATLCLAIEDGRIAYQTGRDVVARRLATGRELWRTRLKPPKGKKGRGGGTLVAHDDLVLTLAMGRLFCLSATDGKQLWTAPASRGPGVANPSDLFVADGLVWQGSSRQGRDPRTGKVQRTLELYKLISPGHHFRCYRSKATDDYLLWTKRGVEFLDLDGEDHMRHDWLRAACKYGFMPANGLLYITPHQCFCYAGVKLNGFNALAARVREGPAGERLQRGPAFGEVGSQQEAVGAADWPMHRHDIKHSGSTPAAVPPKVERRWEAALGGRLTQPVVVGDRLYVARTDAHRVLCLDATSGETVWA